MYTHQFKKIGEELGNLKTSEAAESDHYHTLREVMIKEICVSIIGKKNRPIFILTMSLKRKINELGPSSRVMADNLFKLEQLDKQPVIREVDNNTRIVILVINNLYTPI